MRAFFDTEYIEIHSTPLTLVSIGIVREDGEQLYMVASGWRKRTGGSWFKKNVWPHVAEDYKHTFDEIAMAVQVILQPVREIAVRQGKNDFVLLERLAGQLPMRKIDLEKVWVRVGKPQVPKRGDRHHALDDAFYHREMFEQLCRHVDLPSSNQRSALNQKIADMAAAIADPNLGEKELKALSAATAAVNVLANKHMKYLQGVNMLRGKVSA